MTPRLRLCAVVSLAALAAGCANGSPSNSDARLPADAIGGVGELPVQDAAPLLGFSSPERPAATTVTPTPATAASTTSAPTTTRPTRVTTTTVAVADSIAEALAATVDPARRSWLRSAARAGVETFAGGADTADLVDGNRVLVIGDSILASTARRYGGETCATLEPLGWAVEVDAETGRFIDFGERVLSRRLDDDWDAAVVMLGNNYGANPAVFEEGLRDIVDDLAPRPTVLFTVTLFDPNRAEVNDIVYDVASDYDNVRVVDWSGETTDDPSLLGGDGLHLNDAGRARLAEMIGEALGDAPDGSEGDCLSSDFTDDSATSPTGTTLPGQAPAPVTTAPPGNGGGGNGGGGDGTTTTPQTSPPTTAAPPETTSAPEPTPAPTPEPTSPPPATTAAPSVTPPAGDGGGSGDG